MEALLAQTGHAQITPTSTSVDGDSASVFTVTAPSSPATACVGNVVSLFDGVELAPGETAKIYIVDVEGAALAFVILGADDSLTAEFDGIIASMQIGE